LWWRIRASVFEVGEWEDNEERMCVEFDDDGDKSWKEGDERELGILGDEWEVDDGIGIGITFKSKDIVSREVEGEKLDGVRVEKGNVFSWKITSRLVKNCQVVRSQTW
jgi:hypothetical protein